MRVFVGYKVVYYYIYIYIFFKQGARCRYVSILFCDPLMKFLTFFLRKKGFLLSPSTLLTGDGVFQFRGSLQMLLIE